MKSEYRITINFMFDNATDRDEWYNKIMMKSKTIG